MSLIAAGVLLLVAGCSGTTSHREATSSESAQKAAQLQQALTKAGLPVPSTQAITQLYGEDGGVTCVNAKSDLQSANGTFLFGNPSGRRQVILDPTLLVYSKAVLETYCPQTVADFEARVADLRTAHTIPTSD